MPYRYLIKYVYTYMKNIYYNNNNIIPIINHSSKANIINILNNNDYIIYNS